MKNKLTTIVAALFGLALSVSAQNNKLPPTPAGWLDAYPTVVQAGTHPTLTWGINLPSSLGDHVRIHDGKLFVKQNVTIDITVVGSNVVATNDGRTSEVPTVFTVTSSSSAKQNIFQGSSSNVKANLVWSGVATSNEYEVSFSGKYFFNGVWGPEFASGDGSNNIRIISDGQPFPSNQIIQPFLKPYINETTRVATLGPLDALVLMELTHSNKTAAGYDLQDGVLLVTAKPRSSTNRSGLGDGTNAGQGNQMGNNDGTLNPAGTK